METTYKSKKRPTYQNIANPHRWLNHFPNISRTSQIGKSMSELSRRWKKHANPIKWRKIHEGWVGSKSTQLPSLTSCFTLSIEKQEKQNKVESIVKCCILIMDGQKVVKINPE